MIVFSAPPKCFAETHAKSNGKANDFWFESLDKTKHEVF